MNISNPEIICNESIHPAWMKACYYMDIKVRRVKINKESGLSNFNDFTS